MTAATRFWSKVDKRGADDCWLWTGALTTGYGRFHVAVGVPLVLAHRFAYEALVGRIPRGLDLDHLCRVRACVNPAHLEPVTRRNNLMRGNTIVRAHHEDRDCGSPGDCKNCRRFALLGVS